MKAWLRYTRRSAQSGQAIVLMALAMIVLMGFAVLALDGGRFYTQRRSAQNASDLAALAGLYKYLSTTISNDQIALMEIQRVAEINQIVDPDGTGADGLNTNVQAWWVNGLGQYVNQDGSTAPGTTEPPPVGAQIVNDPTKVEPVGAAGIKVRSDIPYDTFIGGLIGRKSLVAQADGTALLTINTKTFTDNTNSAWLGGSDCDNLTDKIAFNFENIKNAHFLTDVYDDGSFTIGTYNNNTFFDGKLVVRTMAGQNYGPQGGGPYTQMIPYNANPVPNANHGGFTNYTGPTGPYLPVNNPPVAAPKGFPLWSYVTINNVKTQVDASLFRPVAGTHAYFYDMYVKYQPTGLLNKYFGGNPAPAPNVFFTYINAGSGAANTTDLNNAITNNRHGIYFVEGDVTLSGTPNDVTVIATGRVTTPHATNNFSWGNAGVLGLNISVLAGLDLGMPQRCASDTANAVLDTTGSNQVSYSGILYMPYGQGFFGGNWRTSSSNGPIVAYSLNLGGGGHPDNNQGFNFVPNIFQQPYPSQSLYN